jgi:hypothetical protein
MTVDQYDELLSTRQVILSALSALRLTRCEDEDVTVAKARLENWLAENEGRWVA